MNVHVANVISLVTRNLTASSLRKQLLVAEGAIVNTIVTCQAIVGAIMETTLYAKQVAIVTFRLAELDAGPEIYHGAIGRSA
jgi:hypothetical protein